MTDVITGEDLERAEREISQIYNFVVGVDAVERVCLKAGITREAADTFISHHLNNLGRQHLPDLDPRLEPALATMFLHMLSVGATAQRIVSSR